MLQNFAYYARYYAPYASKFLHERLPHGFVAFKRDADTLALDISLSLSENKLTCAFFSRSVFRLVTKGRDSMVTSQHPLICVRQSFRSFLQALYAFPSLPFSSIHCHRTIQCPSHACNSFFFFKRVDESKLQRFFKAYFQILITSECRLLELRSCSY